MGTKRCCGSGGEIRVLTGLRGFAALGVVFLHLYPENWFRTRPDMPAAPSRLNLAVDVFFVLSGYVMCVSHADNFLSGARIVPYAKFLVRRVARIYPLYAAMLVMWGISTAVGLATGRADPAASLCGGAGPCSPLLTIAANVLLVQSWDLAHSISEPAWSVSAEWAVYPLFPLLVAYALGPRRSYAWALVGASAALLAVVALVGTEHAGSLDAWDGTTPFPLMRCFAGFTFGVVLYRSSGCPGTSWMGSDAAVAVPLLALATACVSPLPDLAVYPLLPAAVLCLALNRGWVARAFSNRLAHACGVGSYAIYLVHPWLEKDLVAAEAALMPVLGAPAGAILAGVATCAVLAVEAAALTILVERPARRLVTRRLTALVLAAVGHRDADPPKKHADRPGLHLTSDL